MKSYKLIFIFTLFVLRAAAGDHRWGYSLGLEFDPQVQLLKHHNYYEGTKNFGYSFGPGLIMDKSHFVMSAGLHYKCLQQRSTSEGYIFDTTNGTSYPAYKSEFTTFEHYIDIPICAGVQFGNNKSKFRIMGGTFYSFHYKRSSTHKKEYYDDTSTEIIKKSKKIGELCLGMEWKVSYYYNISP